MISLYSSCMSSCRWTIFQKILHEPDIYHAHIVAFCYIARRLREGYVLASCQKTSRTRGSIVEGRISLMSLKKMFVLTMDFIGNTMIIQLNALLASSKAHMRWQIHVPINCPKDACVSNSSCSSQRTTVMARHLILSSHHSPLLS